MHSITISVIIIVVYYARYIFEALAYYSAKEQERMLMMADFVKDFMNVVKLSKCEGAPELVLDAILSHFGYDDCDLKEGVERLYTAGKIKHTFRSVLNKGEDMPAIINWFKGVLGLSEEQAADATYASSMCDLAEEFLERRLWMHCVYLVL